MKTRLFLAGAAAALLASTVGSSTAQTNVGGEPNGGCYGALVSENARETHRGEGVSAFAKDPQFGLASYGEYVLSFKSIVCG